MNADTHGAEPRGTDRPAPLDVLIVDDEPLARLRLRGLVEACPEPSARVVGEAGDAETALQCLAETPCDVVLLDIVMPGGNGLRLADELRRRPNGPLVVFVTAHGEHALRAFEVDAADYLTKPVRRERLQAALLRVAQRRAREPLAAPEGPVLVVSDRGRVLRVPAAEVLYLKAELKYVTLCSLRGTWLLDDALADLEQRLGDGFLRVHRNAVVALSAVRALERRGGDEADEGWQVQVSNGDWLAVSRRQLPAVREVLAGAAG
ncbi:LytTR family DNA-binding domain-containing protein [Ideonella sp. A 288]|uniref:LytR/AlgR family response regulator transcription factor n=1 Tax=Ideonella sp. A 288 TaxID=1962181 RepID=UPI000B4BCC35|nr:LytTR family DNA-binding domain-containing protein [Ideonella sp. A 288]